MSNDPRPLKGRVEAFRLLQLPGQPQGMHMGTAYLVNDLWGRVQELERVVADLVEYAQPDGWSEEDEPWWAAALEALAGEERVP